MTPGSLGAHDERRRPRHTKSRTGCLVCKRRKVKCDETRPKCKNCTVGNRPCVYAADEATNTSTGSPSAPRRRTSPRPRSAAASLLHEDPGALSISGGFNALHMSLLYHVTTDMADYMALEGDMGSIITCALDSALTAPYALDQLLALSALHHATLQPNTPTAFLFHHQATALQTRALSRFNETREHISDRDVIPSFIFASLLGIHILRNTLADHRDSLGEFVTAFVDYMRIHRGVRTVTNRYWDQLVQSDLKPLQDITRWIYEAEKLTDGTETAPLRAHLESSPDRSTPSVEACLEGLNWAQWMINLEATASAGSNPARGVHPIMAWPLVVTDGYIESLYQRRPEALAVLAFFAAALHRHRRFWVFADAGSGLVRSIVTHVGPFWADTLVWPQQVIAKDWSQS